MKYNNLKTLITILKILSIIMILTFSIALIGSLDNERDMYEYESDYMHISRKYVNTSYDIYKNYQAYLGTGDVKYLEEFSNQINDRVNVDNIIEKNKVGLSQNDIDILNEVIDITNQLNNIEQDYLLKVYDDEIQPDFDLDSSSEYLELINRLSIDVVKIDDIVGAKINRSIDLLNRKTNILITCTICSIILLTFISLLSLYLDIKNKKQ